MAVQSQPRNVRRPTQNDVARLAGVSRGTVSFVVNGLADGKVAISPETQAKVWEAVEQLGYVPNAGAQALRSGTTRTIGLIIHDLRNPHFWETADGVEQEVRAAGYRLLLSSMDLNAAYGEDSFKDLSGRRIDALILMGGLIDQSDAAREILARCLQRQLPIVEINDRLAAEHQIDSVVSDYHVVMAEMMEYLLALGHRRIGLIFGVGLPKLAIDRLDAYQQSLQAAGLPADPALIVQCGPEMEDGYRATLQLLARAERPTAIVAINDILAMSALRAAADCGLQIPDDLSVAGFDDVLAARFLVPRLTTATKDGVRLGREAVRLALERLSNPEKPREIVRLPAKLIVRESTGPAPEVVRMAAAPSRERAGYI